MGARAQHADAVYDLTDGSRVYSNKVDLRNDSEMLQAMLDLEEEARFQKIVSEDGTTSLVKTEDGTVGWTCGNAKYFKTWSDWGDTKNDPIQGVFALTDEAGRLVGFNVIISQRNDPEPIGGKDKPTHIDAYNCHYQVIHPDTRGRGLHDKVIKSNLERFRQAHIKQAVCTVSPFNPASLASIMKNGFEIRDVESHYGGNARYVMVNPDTARDPQSYPADKYETQWINDPRNLAAQTKLLRSGWVGVKMDRCVGPDKDAGELARSGYRVLFAKKMVSDEE
jgi:ribosomal protein S18 acetylase RimI-like enzyme